jgi:Flp pilus assembly protein TadD
MNRRKRCILLMLMLVAAAAGATGLWLKKRGKVEPMPPPPEVALDYLDSDLREAIQEAQAKVQQEPRSAEAWGHLGKLLRTPYFNEEASFCFAQAEKLDPNSVRWPYLRGEALMLATPEDALGPLRHAVEVADRNEPDNLVPRLRLAELLISTGRHEEAETCLRGARDIDPDNPNVIFGLGLLASIRGEFEESRKLLLRCQHSEFTRQKASQHLAAVCQQLGKTEESAKFQKKSQQLPNDDNWADPYIMDYRLVARGKQIRFQYAEHLAAQGKFQEAVQRMHEILVDGPDFRAYVGLGTYLGRIGDIDGAERAYRDALKLRPESAKPWYFLARLHLTRGLHYQGTIKDKAKANAQFAAAAEAARRSLEHKPNDALAHLTLGLALKYLGKQETALASLRSAVECGPEQIDPQYYLGEMLADLGQNAEARSHLEQALQLARPDDPLRKQAQERLEKLKDVK